MGFKLSGQQKYVLSTKKFKFVFILFLFLNRRIYKLWPCTKRQIRKMVFVKKIPQSLFCVLDLRKSKPIKPHIRARWEIKKSCRCPSHMFFIVKLNSRNICFTKSFHFRTPSFTNLHFFVYKGLQGGFSSKSWSRSIF